MGNFWPQVGQVSLIFLALNISWFNWVISNWREAIWVLRFPFSIIKSFCSSFCWSLREFSILDFSAKELSNLNLLSLRESLISSSLESK